MYARQDVQNAHLDLMRIAPGLTRRLLESARARRGSLTSLFPVWPEGRDTEIVHFVIDTLGRFGDVGTIELLKGMVDDPVLANRALGAIKKIRSSMDAYS